MAIVKNAVQMNLIELEPGILRLWSGTTMSVK